MWHAERACLLPVGEVGVVFKEWFFFFLLLSFVFDVVVIVIVVIYGGGIEGDEALHAMDVKGQGLEFGTVVGKAIFDTIGVLGSDVGYHRVLDHLSDSCASVLLVTSLTC